MKSQYLYVLIVLVSQACAGCTEREAGQPEMRAQAKLQCFKDTDCKGERICEAGTCQHPATPSQVVSGAVEKPTSAPEKDAIAAERKKLSLESLIKNRVTKELALINAKERKQSGDGAFQFQLSSQDVQEYDLNSDGHGDYIASLTYCEEYACHGTTTSSEAVVIMHDPRNGYEVIGAIALGIEGTVTVGSDGLISATEIHYGEDDPGCCPSKEIKHTYRVIGSNLSKIN